jgi:butyryl-CoA dehydrogenase
MVDAQGRLTGERNDVALAGLNHKCGWRGTTNTLLNFGEGRFRPRQGAGKGLDGQGAGAVGYLVGRPGEGLRCMFHMMNEARIGVGMAAAMLGMAGYEASLAYARQRPQGRPVAGAGASAQLSSGGAAASAQAPFTAAAAKVVKDATQAQVPIIEHADVKRMLLAQKSYCEGALALELYCARLVDEQHTGDEAASKEAALLLEVLTPIAKSWPSEWCLEANSLAIQVHGGYGYTRDFPVEQYWRDNRLNMIHEGTHGIQALDLLGRKVVMDGGAGLKLLAGRINDTVTRAGQNAATAKHANALAAALQKVGATTKAAWATGLPEEALANATPYLQAFGHLVLAWMWLDVALALPGVQGAPDDSAASPSGAEHSNEQRAFAQGKLAAMRYFFAYELPRIDAWLKVVAEREAVCRTMHDDWF